MTITGRVVDETGIGMPGAILISGGNGATTDQDGNFSMESTDQTVTANYVGYEPLEKPISGFMEFKMNPSQSSELAGVEIVADAFVKKVYRAELIVWVMIILAILGLIYAYKKGWFNFSIA